MQHSECQFASIQTLFSCKKYTKINNQSEALDFFFRFNPRDPKNRYKIPNDIKISIKLFPYNRTQIPEFYAKMHQKGNVRQN